MHFKNYKKCAGQVLNYSSNNQGTITLKEMKYYIKPI